uniref:NADH-ubiquinone oxidoreductase chain 2 n=1 Tax=Calomicrus pinicola TaxID=1553172 RepID=A0A343C147_9CUCU|nr:NADH dehydrogenase subunit 2 [Calomicrus pinicola]
MLFFNSMMIGTLIAISAYSWLNMWIGLEINLLSIIPLMKSYNNSFPAEATLKYFITQALASTFILFSIISMLNSSEYMIEITSNFYFILLNSALFTKMGAAPFHTWFPEVLDGLNWSNNLILLTWQKIAPMVLVMYNMKMNLFFSFIILFSSIISGIFGLNQISLRKIMAYSSINHIAWMLSSMLNLKLIWVSYFLIYSIITSNLIFMFMLLNVFTLTQLFSSLNLNKLIKLLFICNFLSLGGLPPFLGFLPKWLVINQLINSKFYFLATLLIIFTLVTLYFYIRMTFSSLSISMSETLLISLKIKNFLTVILTIFSLMSLILCTSIFNMF